MANDSIFRFDDDDDKLKYTLSDNLTKKMGKPKPKTKTVPYIA